jgi:hypothetical protein
MHACNRRSFVTQILAGTAALAVVGRACADSADDPRQSAGAAPACGGCQYYSAKPGDAAGACAFDGGKQVAADDGCGHFKAAGDR